MSDGRLTVIEGIDGAGKKTQANKLAEKVDGIVFPFPNYDTEVGQVILGNLMEKWVAADVEQVRDLEAPVEGSIRKVYQPTALINAMVMQSLQAVNRYEFVGRIETALRAGRHVILDRWWPSGYVYGACDGLDRDWLLRIHKSLPQPDDLILLAIAPSDSIARRPERRDRYENDSNMPVRRALYQQLWQQRSHHAVNCGRRSGACCTCSLDDQSRWHVVDGTGSVDDVHQRILACVQS